jgi:hypothetical protein
MLNLGRIAPPTSLQRSTSTIRYVLRAGKPKPRRLCSPVQPTRIITKANQESPHSGPHQTRIHQAAATSSNPIRESISVHCPRHRKLLTEARTTDAAPASVSSPQSPLTPRLSEEIMLASARLEGQLPPSASQPDPFQLQSPNCPPPPYPKPSTTAQE